MADFAIEIEGVTEKDQGRWVLAVDAVGDRLLVAHEDKTLHWHSFSECKFRTMADPTGIQPVVVVRPEQMQKGSGLMLPRNGL